VSSARRGVPGPSTRAPSRSRVVDAPTRRVAIRATAASQPRKPSRSAPVPSPSPIAPSPCATAPTRRAAEPVCRLATRTSSAADPASYAGVRTFSGLDPASRAGVPTFSGADPASCAGVPTPSATDPASFARVPTFSVADPHCMRASRRRRAPIQRPGRASRHRRPPIQRRVRPSGRFGRRPSASAADRSSASVAVPTSLPPIPRVQPRSNVSYALQRSRCRPDPWSTPARPAVWSRSRFTRSWPEHGRPAPGVARRVRGDGARLRAQVPEVDAHRALPRLENAARARTAGACPARSVDATPGARDFAPLIRSSREHLRVRAQRIGDVARDLRETSAPYRRRCARSSRSERTVSETLRALFRKLEQRIGDVGAVPARTRARIPWATRVRAERLARSRRDAGGRSRPPCRSAARTSPRRSSAPLAATGTGPLPRSSFRNSVPASPLPTHPRPSVPAAEYRHDHDAFHDSRPSDPAALRGPARRLTRPDIQTCLLRRPACPLSTRSRPRRRPSPAACREPARIPVARARIRVVYGRKVHVSH
jgi:hypothetical protein